MAAYLPVAELARIRRAERIITPIHSHRHRIFSGLTQSTNGDPLAYRLTLVWKGKAP
jgi:hypothetical protein